MARSSQSTCNNYELLAAISMAGYQVDDTLYLFDSGHGSPTCMCLLNYNLLSLLLCHSKFKQTFCLGVVKLQSNTFLKSKL